MVAVKYFLKPLIYVGGCLVLNHAIEPRFILLISADHEVTEDNKYHSSHATHRIQLEKDRFSVLEREDKVEVMLEQCFLKCGLRTPGSPQDLLGGPQYQNYLSAMEEIWKNLKPCHMSHQYFYWLKYIGLFHEKHFISTEFKIVILT